MYSDYGSRDSSEASDWTSPRSREASEASDWSNQRSTSTSDYARMEDDFCYHECKSNMAGVCYLCGKLDFQTNREYVI